LWQQASKQLTSGMTSQRISKRSWQINIWQNHNGQQQYIYKLLFSQPGRTRRRNEERSKVNEKRRFLIRRERFPREMTLHAAIACQLTSCRLTKIAQLKLGYNFHLQLADMKFVFVAECKHVSLFEVISSFSVSYDSVLGPKVNCRLILSLLSAPATN